MTRHYSLDSQVALEFETSYWPPNDIELLHGGQLLATGVQSKIVPGPAIGPQKALKIVPGPASWPQNRAELLYRGQRVGPKTGFLDCLCAKTGPQTGFLDCFGASFSYFVLYRGQMLAQRAKKIYTGMDNTVK